MDILVFAVWYFGRALLILFLDDDVVVDNNGSVSLKPLYITARSPVTWIVNAMIQWNIWDEWLDGFWWTSKQFLQVCILKAFLCYLIHYSVISDPYFCHVLHHAFDIFLQIIEPANIVHGYPAYCINLHYFTRQSSK